VYFASSFSIFSVCVLRMRPPPRSPLFPYTTLFRSELGGHRRRREAAVAHDLGGHTLTDLGLGPAIAPETPVRVRVHVDEATAARSEEHTSELQSLRHLVCRLLLEKKNEKPRARLCA